MMALVKLPWGYFVMIFCFLLDFVSATSRQSVTYRYREFFIFLVVSEPVSEKNGTGEKSRNRYRKNLVPEKGLGTGTGKNWYRS